MRTWGVAPWLILAVVLGHCCHHVSGQTAYLVPGMATPANEANHSFSKLGHFFEGNPANYDTVLLTNDFRIDPSLWPLQQPYRLKRNLTISTANYPEHGYALLETYFLEERVIIPQGISITFKDLALGGDRKSSGQGLPFFAGEGDTSVLVLDNVVRVRAACARNAAVVANTLAKAPLPPTSNTIQGYPAVQGNQVLLTDLPFRGAVYTDSVHAVDIAGAVSPGDVRDTATYYAGYVVRQINTTRICLSYVSDACVQEKGADPCIMQQVDALLEAEANPRGLRGTKLAAIVAPVVVAGLLLLAAVGAVALVRKRRRQRQALPLPALPLHHSRSGILLISYKSTSTDIGQGADCDQGRDRGSDSTNMPGALGGASGSVEALAVGNRGGGWKLLAYHTSPEFKDATPNDRIKLGMLLGAGSFGRVYKGVWHHMTVAVKVLQHDSTTAAAIANEVDLVMSFRHPNITAAYHCVTWTSSGDPSGHEHKQLSGYHGSMSGSGLTALSGLSSPASSGLTVPGQFQEPWFAQPQGAAAAGAAGFGQASFAQMRLGTVVEGRTFSSRGTIAKPPGIDSTVGTTPGSGAMHASSSSSSSSNVSAVLSGAADGIALSGLQRTGPTGASPTSCIEGSLQRMQDSAHASTAALISQLLKQASTRSSCSQPNKALLLAPAAAAATPAAATPAPATPDPAAEHTAAPGIGASAGGSLSAAGSGGRDKSTEVVVAISNPAEELSSLDRAGPGLRLCAVELGGPAGAGGGEEFAAAANSGIVVSSQLATPQGSSVSTLQLVPFTLAQLHEHGRQGSSLNTAPTTPSALDLESGAGFTAAAATGRGWHAVREDLGLEESGGEASYSVARGADATGAAAETAPVAAGNKAGAAGGAARSRATAGWRVLPAVQPAEAQTWLLLEFCDGGTLLDLLQGGRLEDRNKEGRNMAHVLTLLHDIAAGMAYLHSRNVLHGDLKPGNVLIKNEQGAPYNRVAKVSDFGLSRALQVGQSHRSTRTMGTMNHAPPELLRIGRLSPAGDVYAFGVIMWEVFTGQVAFSGLHYGEVFELVALRQQRPPVPPEMPRVYAALMVECWASDPFARPAFGSVQQRLQQLLDAVVQDGKDAVERFVADL